jgi:Signal transduction histidine kinase
MGIFFIVMALLVMATPRRAQAIERPRAVRGHLDASGWDFATMPALDLVGEWEFFPGRLDIGAEESAPGFRSVPDHWDGEEAGGRDGQGSGAYRLSIRLPQNRPELALRYWTVSSACAIEANGTPVAVIGRPSTEAALSIPQYNPGLASVSVSGPELVLTVRVSNYEYRTGGFWHELRLGSLDSLSRQRTSDIALSLVLATAIATMAVNSLFLFLARRKQKGYLFLALFAFVLALRPLVIGDYFMTAIFPGIGYGLIIRLEYFTVFWSYIAGAAYFLYFFGLQSDRRLMVVLLAPGLPFALLDLCAPISILSRSLFFFLILALALLCYLAINILPKALKSRESGMWNILFGTMIVIAAATHDALAALQRVNSISLIVWAFGVFVLLQSALQARRFGEDQRRLEAHVAEKELLLNEVHHRVRNSLQIVSSILSMRANRSADGALKAAYGSIKDRIRAISLAHDQLYRLGKGDSVELSGYCAALIGALEEGLGEEDGRGRVALKSSAMQVPADFAINCGLIITELVCNSFEHAPSGLRPRVEVTVEGLSNGARILVRDDGPGFPEAYDPEGQDGTGLRIVRALAKDHGGRVSIGGSGFASVAVDLKFGQGGDAPQSGAAPHPSHAAL